MNTTASNIVLIGAGNVATHLGTALHKKGHKIIQVYNRSEKSARELSEKLKCTFITELTKLDYSADIYLFCLKDDVLLNVLRETKFTNQILVHTAGSLPLDIFKDFGFHFGVLYPVQTFIKGRDLDLSLVPFCVEASTLFAENILLNLAFGLSQKVQLVDSDQRKIIHLAAVFVCNFTNHMYLLANRLMCENGLDFNLLKPLIVETTAKVMETDPGTAQTGPAKRGDQSILDEHIQLLSDVPEMQKIYIFISESIANSEINRKKE